MSSKEMAVCIGALLVRADEAGEAGQDLVGTDVYFFNVFPASLCRPHMVSTWRRSVTQSVEKPLGGRPSTVE